MIKGSASHGGRADGTPPTATPSKVSRTRLKRTSSIARQLPLRLKVVQQCDAVLMVETWTYKENNVSICNHLHEFESSIANVTPIVLKIFTTITKHFWKAAIPFNEACSVWLFEKTTSISYGSLTWMASLLVQKNLNLSVLPGSVSRYVGVVNGDLDGDTIFRAFANHWGVELVVGCLVDGRARVEVLAGKLHISVVHRESLEC